ncbi:MAG: phosphotransferase [Acidimicrobiia bacterium]
MAVTNPRTARLRDDAIPAMADLLVADGVPEPITTAFATFGVEVTAATARQITWWPGRSLTVRFGTELVGPAGGDHDVVATTGEIPDGAVVVEAADQRVGVWTVPHDPALPGLAPALDASVAAGLLADLGVSDATPRPRLRAYRPGRRAVVEVTTGVGPTIYLKVVRPHEAERLHRHHRSLPVGLPVPESLGVDPDRGIVVLQAMPGRTLRSVLDDPGGDLPDPGAVDGLLTRLPQPLDGAVARSPIDRLGGLVALLGRILPEEADRVGEIVAGIGPDDAPADVPSHGDFYESQLLVHGGVVTGLLDVDTYGLGRPADDPATMIGHLASWQRSSAARPERVGEFAGLLLRRWDARLDPVDLRRRAAAVVVGLATGPFRVQHATWPEDVGTRLAIAERWLESARRVGEKGLIGATGPSHPRPAS